jgi:CheY-like chemotaxis protein
MASILAVDDEQDILDLVKFTLEKQGHRVSLAQNGAQALKMLGVEPADSAALRPDIIVLDIMMPVVSGYTVASRLLDDLKTKSIPIIFLTAKEQVLELSQMSPNVKEYIVKPFDPGILRETVTQVLARSSANADHPPL